MVGILPPLIMESVCRICRSTCESLVNIFVAQQEEAAHLELAYMINECTGYLVICGDSLPQNICPACIESAKDAFRFKEMCKKNYEYFYKMLQANENAIKKEVETSPEHGMIIKEEYVIQEQQYISLEYDKGREDYAKKANDSQLDECSEDSEDEDADSKLYNGEQLENDQNHKCPTCLKVFKKRYKLMYHMNTHTGNRPYNCPDCGKAFSCKDYLRRHRRIHTGEKKYMCPQCSKNFRTNWNLTNHLRIHSGELPYACPICSKRFANRSSQKVHTVRCT